VQCTAMEPDRQRLRVTFAEREAERNEERVRANEVKKLEEQKEIDKRWNQAIFTAKKTGELTANWLELRQVHPDVANLGEELRVVRLVGNPFQTIPSWFFEHLIGLVSLNLGSCGLSEIPKEVKLLTRLQELHLFKNQLEAVPEELGELSKLKCIDLTSNKLQNLPESLGMLSNLETLSLEQNLISLLPESIVYLKCCSLSWSRIGLKRLPRDLFHFRDTLVSLKADHNKIRQIPDCIGNLSALKILSLCNNQIAKVPKSICNCSALERLWLDWNIISELPPEFVSLEKLQSLHLEGNPIRLPQMEVISKGTVALRKWFHANIAFYRSRGRRRVIQQLQSMLATMAEENLHDLAFFEAGLASADVGDKGDLFFGFIPKYLFDHAIPTWNGYIRSIQRNPADLEEKKARCHHRRTIAEKRDALEEELSAQEVLSSSKASIVEEEVVVGEESSVFKREAHRRSVILNEIKTMEAELSNLKLTSKEKNPGDHRIVLSRRAMSKLPRFFTEFEFSEAEVFDALQNYEDQFGKVATANHVARFRKCKCIRAGKQRLCVPPSLDYNCERKGTLLKIGLVAFLDKIRRDSALEEDRVLAERVAEIGREAETFAASQEGKEFFRLLAEIETLKKIDQERKTAFIAAEQQRFDGVWQSEKKSFEARRLQLEKVKGERTQKLEKRKMKLQAKLEKARGWVAKQLHNEIEDIDDELENIPESAELAALEVKETDHLEHFENLKTEQEIMKSMGNFPPVKRSKEVLSRMAHMKEKMKRAYVEAESARVKKEVRRDYALMRKILFSWFNTTVRTIFREWRAFAFSQVFWRRRSLERQRHQIELKDASKEFEIIYKEIERSKWKEFVDKFTDRPYWQHIETGEVRFEKFE